MTKNYFYSSLKEECITNLLGISIENHTLNIKYIFDLVKHFIEAKANNNYYNYM